MLKGDLRKQAILDTAENLFFEKGYAAATIQDILDALNCSKGSFYHHFESKLQVLTELCRQRAEAGYAEFKKQTYDDGLGYLNGLIYYAMPFRAGEDKNLSLLLPLQGLAQGAQPIVSYNFGAGNAGRVKKAFLMHRNVLFRRTTWAPWWVVSRMTA